jgi:integrase
MSKTLTVEVSALGNRRKYGQGTVRNRNGSWQIAYHPIPGGKRVWETIGTEAAGVTEEVAEHALMERLVTIGRGQGAQFLGHPFDVVAKEWQRNQVAMRGLSTRSQELLEVALDCHLLPAFGGQFLHQISVSDIERYVAKKMTLAPGEPGAVPVQGKVAASRPEPVGVRSIQQQLSVLRQIFNWAKREGLVADNPAELVEISTNPREKKQIKPMEQEQVISILEQSGDEERETMLMTLAALGLRLGELLALDINDLNKKERSVTVQRTLSTKKGSTVINSYPKTGSGFRVLKISEDLMNRLERQEARAKLRHKVGQPTLLFPNSRGKIRGEGNFRRDIWRPTLAGAGVPLTFTPHSLRHTFASELIAQGVPITKIAYLMGHANPATTMRIYASIFKRHEADQADITDLYSPIKETGAGAA